MFLYTGFIRTLPKEYEEAAQVDGASLLRIFVRVVFPLLLPVTGTVAILSGLFIWNDFFVSLIFLSGSAQETVPVVDLFVRRSSISTQWNHVFAAIVIALLPVIVFFVLRSTR